MSTEDDAYDLPAAIDDAVSTGAAADSADCDERLKGLPRILRYAMLIMDGSRHVAERLIAEIHEVCPQLPHSAAWAFERTPDTGLALAAELDRRAATQDEPNLRSLADSVRLVCLPTPGESIHFEGYRRVGKALVHAFYVSARRAEQELCAELERFTFGWAALPACTGMLSRGASAATNAAYLGGRMAEHRIIAAKAAVRHKLTRAHLSDHQAASRSAKTLSISPHSTACCAVMK